jgi:hypothetical protein
VLVPDSVEGDTVAAADSILVTLPREAFPTLEADSFVMAVGVALRADQEGYVDLAATDQGGRGASMTWFVKIDSSGTLVGRQESRLPSFDGFVVDEWPPGPDDVLSVGGIPSARTFLRFDVPPGILNASTIVRATLLMVPAEPLLGAVADSVTLVALPLRKDFGPKSKPEVLPRDTLVRELEGLPPDTVVREQVVLAVGTVDSIVIDITRIVQPWQGDSTVSQSLVLLLSPEGGSIAELRLPSPASTPGGLALRLTYVPFFSYEEPLP